MTHPSNNSGLSLEEILNELISCAPPEAQVGLIMYAAQHTEAQIEQHYLGLLAEKKNLAIYRVPEDYREAKGFNQAVDQMAKNIRGQ